MGDLVHPLFGLVLLFLGFALFGTYLNYIIFIIVLILLRAGFGTVDTTIHSFSTKLYRKEVSRIFLNLDIAWYTGAFLGPLIVSAVLFFDFLISYLFFIMAFTYTLSIIIFYRIYPKKINQEDKLPSGKDVTLSHRKGFYSLKDPVVIMGSLVLFFYMGSLTGLSSWMTTYFLSFGVRVAYSSAVLSMYWLFSIIGMLIVKRIISKIKEIAILAIGCLGCTLCLAIFSFIPNVYGKVVILPFMAIFFSVIFPLTSSITVQRNQKNSGTILGFTIGFAFAGSIVLQPVYGYVAEHFGKSYIAFIAFGGTLIGLVFTVIFFRIIKNRDDFKKTFFHKGKKM